MNLSTQYQIKHQNQIDQLTTMLVNYAQSRYKYMKQSISCGQNFKLVLGFIPHYDRYSHPRNEPQRGIRLFPKWVTVDMCKEIQSYWQWKDTLLIVDTSDTKGTTYMNVKGEAYSDERCHDVMVNLSDRSERYHGVVYLTIPTQQISSDKFQTRSSEVEINENKTHYCTECHQWMTNHEHLEHLEQYPSTECQWCLHTFHNINDHLQTPHVTCYICLSINSKQSKMSPEQLNLHYQREHNIIQTCPYCDYVIEMNQTYDYSNLYHHLKTHQKYCDICDQHILGNQSYFITHLLQHPICTIKNCGIQCQNQSDLKQHMIEQHSCCCLM